MARPVATDATGRRRFPSDEVGGGRPNRRSDRYNRDMGSDPPIHARGRVRLSNRKKILFAVVSVVAFFAALEGVGRMVFDSSPDARWEYEQRHLISEGFPSLNDALEPDPILFWRLRPNLSGVTLDGKVSGSELRFTLSTDEYGHRLAPVPSQTERTVLFLGDSCTLGIGVEDDQAFPSLVQARMSGTRCINGGVPGYTAYQGRLAYELLELDSPADAVVITFGVNDDTSWDDRSDPEHGALLADRRSDILNRFRLVQFFGRLGQSQAPASTSDESSKRPRLNEAEFDEQIRSIIRRCRATGSRPILVVWPYLAQMYRAGETWKQQVLRRIGETEGIAVVDLVPVFRARRDPSLFVDVVHAGPSGCVLVAETLIPVLSEALQDRAAAAS